jgi:hypothetical protein
MSTPLRVKILYGTTSAFGSEIDVGSITTYDLSGLTNGPQYYIVVMGLGDFPVVATKVLFKRREER